MARSSAAASLEAGASPAEVHRERGTLPRTLHSQPMHDARMLRARDSVYGSVGHIYRRVWPATAGPHTLMPGAPV